MMITREDTEIKDIQPIMMAIECMEKETTETIVRTVNPGEVKQGNKSHNILNGKVSVTAQVYITVKKSPSTPISELIEVASQVTENSKAKSSEEPKCETAQKPVPFRIPKKTQKPEVRLVDQILGNETFVQSRMKLPQSEPLDHAPLFYSTKRRHRDTGREVAIKNLSLEGEKQGFPLSAIREIKTLRLLNHRNVVQLLDVATDSNQNIRNPESEIFLVFEYVEHDLKGLLESDYLQLNFIQAAAIVRRIIILNRGILKLADFGLARQIDPENTRPYTKQYRYLECRVCGSMISRVWPGVTLLPSYNMVPKQHFERRLRANIQKWIPEGAADLIDKMLTLDPSKRLTCREAPVHSIHRRHQLQSSGASRFAG
ncbi:unnamed protein product, partial [Mesorhabditis belari]|uniref:Protein kinase domain-containing protein n=1 Tax=Mesorhabditis belari TaxID=2138241 RepID=A0AAF3FI13_9BILA